MYNVPILKPDHEIKVGSWVIILYAVSYVVESIAPDTQVVKLFSENGGGRYVDLGHLYDIADLPQAQYCIWRDDTVQLKGCTCGAKHTSFPDVHLTFCGEHK
jgi:hypothetical protein